MWKRILPVIGGIVCLYALACNPEDVPTRHKIPKLSWIQPLIANLELAGTITPVIGEGVVVFSFSRTFDTQAPLMGLNAETGNVEWKWTYLHPNSNKVGPKDYQYSFNGTLVYSTKGQIYGVNIKTGTVQWSNLIYENSRDYNEGWSDLVINLFVEPQANKYYNEHLGVANVQSGAWKTGYTLIGDEIWRPGVSSFTGMISAETDTLLYFSGTYYRPDSLQSKPFLKGYNITTDTLLFEHEGPESFGFLEIYEDYLLAGGTYLRCYDRQTGVLRWQQNIPNGVNSSGVVITGDKVLVNDGDNFAQKLHLFDIETGSRIWQSEVIETSSRLVVHKGVIYATGDRELKAINLEDGKLLWSIPSPHAKTISGAFFAPVVAIDPKTDRLFTSDYVYAMCYQLE
ncbi:MAG: PQQ-binding-like beta-propeller repeat protein [Bacteroidia bacterium]|nr:PQQ-binding-like beta-propeller repeat protein [Bacteroidia bacterium]